MGGLGCEAKLLVRLLPFFQAPETFGSKVRVAAAGQGVEAGLRFGAMSVLAEGPAVRRDRSPERHGTG